MSKLHLFPNLIGIYKQQHLIALICLLILIVSSQNVYPQQQIAQDTYAIFEQSCLICHGPDGAYKETLLIEYNALIKENGPVMPGNPEASRLYKRLLGEGGPLMPLGGPPLPDSQIETVKNWILAGAPDWAAPPTTNGQFISPSEILDAIETHLMSLSSFDRAFARYFTMTHLHNAGESVGILQEYRKALFKLVNSLSWGVTVTNPQPIDPQGTIFYIDLRHYEWDRNDGWTKIEAEYPYHISFDAPTETTLKAQLGCLQAETKSNIPSIHVDWFVAQASLPPLYHDLLSLPLTDRELETRLEVDVLQNLLSAPGVRVWRAGTNNSGVSNNNRVIERHTSRYGAYWKSYDFAGSVGTQNIFTYPLSFTHDGGEVIFNLPNGLQAYYVTNASGFRLDDAPINIVSNPAASDPTVRNGLSCFGCHTEGMKTFEDEVRSVIESNAAPVYDKAQALRLYVEQSEINTLLQADMDRYKEALEETGGAFDDIEPISRFHEAFQDNVHAAYAAAVVGLETEAFLEKIRENVGLQNAGLLVLDSDNGSVKRDAWTSSFRDIVFTLNFPTAVVVPPVVTPPEQKPDAVVRIPDPNLRAAIAEALDKNSNAPITVEDMKKLKEIYSGSRGIRDLTGLQFATNLGRLKIDDNAAISDLSPLAGLINLKSIQIFVSSVSDLSPLAELIKLERMDFEHADISNLSPLVGLTGLKILDFHGNDITDISPLARLTELTRLNLSFNDISDISPLAGLTNLKWLVLNHNEIPNLSPLDRIRANMNTLVWHDNPGFPKVGPAIEGPWLWLVLPNTDPSSSKDLLSEVSGGMVTETEIATHGAVEGSPVGNDVWTSRKLLGGNVEKMLGDRIDGAIIYGAVSFHSPRQQVKTLYVGSHNEFKVWLNGTLIYESLRYHASFGYTDSLPVTLKPGKNVLLVMVRPLYNAFFGFEPGTEYTLSMGVGYTFSPTPIHLGDTFTLNIHAENISDLAGWQFDIAFDPAVLEAINVSEGDFLKTDGGNTFFQSGSIDNAAGKIAGLSAIRLSTQGVTGTGTVLQVTFKAKSPGETELTLQNFEFTAITGQPIPAVPPQIYIAVEEQLAAGDVNRDGRVSILDLVLIAQQLTNTVPADSPVDLNGDGVVSILDLVLAIREIDNTTALAPSAVEAVWIDPVMIEAWVAQAHLEDDGSLVFKQGIEFLENLLASLIPKETALLHNYPNPFNPETWIPYQLAEAAEVMLTIYDMNGQLIRRLTVGHKAAGMYRSRSRAAYWDGRNQLGEFVASGLYFYTLTVRSETRAGEFSATRRMLILK